MSEFENFNVSDVSRLQQLSPQELALLERRLLEHFETSLRQYFEKRLDRVDFILEQLNQSLVSMSENERNWLKIYQFETEIVSKMLISTENKIEQGIRDDPHQVEEFEKELVALVKNLRSPLEMENNVDHNHSLPFQNHFAKVIEPYKKQLTAIVNERDLQTSMINANAKGKLTIIWKQYLAGGLDTQQKMIQDTLAELSELHKEFYGLNSGKEEKQQWQQWHRSAVSVKDIERSRSANGDDFYNLENRYFPKNKVELTNIRLGINQKDLQFEAAQNQWSSGEERVRLMSGATRLSNKEIELDIQLLRAITQTRELEGQQDIADDAIDVEEESQDQLDEREVIEIGDIDMEPDSSSSDEALTENSDLGSPEQSQDAYLQSAYREFLKQDIPLLTPSQGLFKLPKLPPLDSFPPA